MTIEETQKLKINHNNSKSEPANLRENRKYMMETNDNQYVNIVKFNSFEKQRVNLDKRTLHHSIISMKDNSYYMILEDFEHLNSPKFNLLHRYMFSTDLHEKKNKSLEYNLVNPLFNIYLNHFLKKLMLHKRPDSGLSNRKMNGMMNKRTFNIHNIHQFPENIHEIDDIQFASKKITPKEKTSIYSTPMKSNRNLNQTQEIIKEKLRNVEIMKKIMLLREVIP